MEKSKLKEEAKKENAKKLKENAVSKATVWNADTIDFKDFMNDEDMKKDKAILKPQKGEAGKLIYQVKFIMRYLSYTFMEILFFYTSMM